MKVLQVHNFYKTPGGECAVVEAERALLKSHGHAVVRFTADNRAIDTQSPAARGAAYLQIPWNFGVARLLSRFVAAHKPEVAHVHNVFPLLSPSVYAVLKQQRIPVVQTVHNFRFLCPNGQFFTHGHLCEACRQDGYIAAVRNRCMHDNLVTSALYASAVALGWKTGNFARNIDRFIVLNRFSADKLAGAGIPERKIRICGNFIANIADRPAPKRRYALYIGRLSPEKGLKTLLEAFRNVSDPPLKIAGTGPMESQLRCAIREQNLRHVEMLGFVGGEAKQRLIAEALFTVVPSVWYENFPMSVVESLALGTPVVASRIGGLPEMMQDCVSGLLFSPGATAELVDAVRELAHAAGDRLNKMSEAALAHAHRCFSPGTHYKELTSLYQDVCGRALAA